MKQPVDSFPKPYRDSAEALADRLGLDAKVIEDVTRQLVIAHLLVVETILRSLTITQAGERAVLDTPKSSEKVVASVSEAMLLLGLSRSSIYGLMASGRLAWCQPGKHRRILMNSIQQVLKEVRTPAA